ncbi:MAG: aminoacyl-histidine dipeptidase [Bacteroidales bacterium]|jgi:dipeptidase D|nr:aminoacyl-histidine dipeptidase [Bacteroidales bacterium]
MSTIKDLKPALVWNNFYQLTRYPRPSKHEEKVREFLLKWGKEHKVETFADATGNVIMKVPATPGYENRKTVILQGHMDMVPQKNNDVKHDFLTDPIETWIDGEWVKAKGTTLGADDGMGVAMAMAVAESKDLKHGPIEILITYDEETGMTGANKLQPGVLKGDILINLDSETEGELYVGCAGGMDTEGTGRYTKVRRPKGYQAYSLQVKGCQGGHSGMDIILCRANANRIAARLTDVILAKTDTKLVEFTGGNMRNAIPREAEVLLYIKDPSKVARVLRKAGLQVLDEFAQTDPDMSISLTPAIFSKGYVKDDEARALVNAVLACPDGVERMSQTMPGTVETSNNLAIVKIAGGKVAIVTLMRSFIDSAKVALSRKIAAVLNNAGIKTRFVGAYSGWAPDDKSVILRVMKESYKKLYGKEPEVMAIHAGLECGIIGGIYPGLDMISCGPTLKSPHSPDERCYIPSVQKAWDFLVEVLKDIPER